MVAIPVITQTEVVNLWDVLGSLVSRKRAALIVTADNRKSETFVVTDQFTSADIQTFQESRVGE